MINEGPNSLKITRRKSNFSKKWGVVFFSRFARKKTLHPPIIEKIIEKHLSDKENES